MKILIVSGCVFAENCGRSKFTGLDYVVGDIATKLGEQNDVTVFTITQYPKNSVGENFKIESYKYNELVKYIKPSAIKRYLQITSERKLTIKEKVKLLRTILVTDKLTEIIKKNRYDVVHFNGVSMSLVIPCISAIRNHVPFVYTLHGLISFSENSRASIADRAFEYNLLKLMKNKQMVYSVVSTGVRNTINAVEETSSDCSRVILNAVSNHISINDTYSWEKLKADKTIVVLIGTIGEIKNQYQFLRALTKVDPNLLQQFQVVLLGYDEYPEGNTEQYIHKLGLDKIVYKFGFANKTQLDYFYRKASYNVLISKCEGFGLSIIEAKSYGIPSLVFKSMDAVPDLYSKQSMWLVDDETDAGIAEGFTDMVNQKWDRNRIREEAQGFALDKYTEYQNLYQDVMSSFEFNITENDIWSLNQNDNGKRKC